MERKPRARKQNHPCPGGRARLQARSSRGPASVRLLGTYTPSKRWTSWDPRGRARRHQRGSSQSARAWSRGEPARSCPCLHRDPHHVAHRARHRVAHRARHHVAHRARHRRSHRPQARHPTGALGHERHARHQGFPCGRTSRDHMRSASAQVPRMQRAVGESHRKPNATRLAASPAQRRRQRAAHSAQARRGEHARRHRRC